MCSINNLKKSYDTVIMGGGVIGIYFIYIYFKTSLSLLFVYLLVETLL